MIGQPQTCRVAPGDEGTRVVLRGNPEEIIVALKGVYDEPMVTVLFYRKVSRQAGRTFGRNELHCLLWTMLQEQVNHSSIPVSDRQQELEFLWGSLHDMIGAITEEPLTIRLRPWLARIIEGFFGPRFLEERR